MINHPHLPPTAHSTGRRAWPRGVTAVGRRWRGARQRPGHPVPSVAPVGSWACRGGGRGGRNVARGVGRIRGSRRGPSDEAIAALDDDPEALRLTVTVRLVVRVTPATVLDRYAAEVLRAGRIPSTRRGSRRWRTRRHAPRDRTRQRTAPRARSGTLPTPVRSSPAFRGSRWRTRPWPSSGLRPRSCVVCARRVRESLRQGPGPAPIGPGHRPCMGSGTVPGQDRPVRPGQSRLRLRVVRRSTATSWRSTSSSVSFDAVKRASSASRPATALRRSDRAAAATCSRSFRSHKPPSAQPTGADFWHPAGRGQPAAGESVSEVRRVWVAVVV